MNHPIKRDTIIAELLSKYPQKSIRLAQELSMAGLHCLGCSGGTKETLESGMRAHGIDEKQIDQLIAQLNKILTEEDLPPTISLTERAAQKFREILIQENKIGWSMRFGMEGRSCCGIQYYLDYSKESESTDTVFESYGIQIHVQKDFVPELMGTTIDYTEDAQGSGFKIIRSHSHGCGGCCCS